MIVILHPSIDPTSFDYQYTLKALQSLPNIEAKVHSVVGNSETLTEVYLIGDTLSLSQDNIEALPGVSRVGVEFIGDHPSCLASGERSTCGGASK